MIQIDPLLAYAMASTLAAAEHQRQAVPPARRTIWFGLTVLWLVITFAPQAVFLLWHFPAWETMFVVLEYDQVPVWLVVLTPASIVAAGAAGFVITRRLLRARPVLAWSLVGGTVGLSLWLVTVGWDGTGYRRLLYAGNGDDWARGVAYPLTAFLTSDVARTLVWLEAALLLPYGVMLAILWRRQRPRGAGASAGRLETAQARS